MTQQHTPDALDHFVHQIMNIQPTGYNIVGRGMPGAGGSSAVLEGAFNSSMDTTQLLKQATFEFGIAIREHKPKEDIVALAKQIEGFLLDESVLSVLLDHQSDTLIDELHAIVSTH